MQNQKLLSLREAAKNSGINQDYLRVLINRKVLLGTKIGKDWYVGEDNFKRYCERYGGKKNGKSVSLGEEKNKAKITQDDAIAKSEKDFRSEFKLSKTQKLNIAHLLNKESSEFRYDLSQIPPKIRYVSKFGKDLSDYLQKNTRRAWSEVHYYCFRTVYRTITAAALVGLTAASMVSLFASPTGSLAGIFASEQKILSRLVQLVAPGSESITLLQTTSSKPSLNTIATSTSPAQSKNTPVVIRTIIREVPLSPTPLPNFSHFTTQLSSELRSYVDTQIGNIQFPTFSTTSIQKDISHLSDQILSLQGQLTRTTAVANSGIQMVTLSQRINTLDSIQITNGATITSGSLGINAGNLTVSGTISAGNLTIASLTASGPLTVSGTGTSTFAGSIASQSGNFIVTSQGTTNNLVLNPYGGNTGIGTTTPWGQFSVNPNNIGTAPELAIGSSTKTDFIVTNAGLVGIGTTSPSATLHVAGTEQIDNSSIPFTQLNSTGASVAGDLRFSINGTLDALLRVSSSTVSGVNGSIWDFQDRLNGGAHRLIINADGHVGAGTTSPWGLLSLDVSNVSGPEFVIGSSTKTHFMVTNGGSLGISTTTPDATLSITQNANSTPLISAYRITDTAPSGDFINYKSKAGSTLFRVDNSGNLAAGGIINTGSQTITSTSQPQFRVQYDASDEITTSVTSVGATTLALNGSAPSLAFTPQSNSTNTFNFTNAASASILSVDTTNQRVGVGTTSPWGQLSVNANGLANSAPQFVVGSSTATNFIVSNGGNVGIGTANLTAGSNLTIQNSSGGTNSGISFTDSTGAQYASIASNGDPATSRGLFFQTPGVSGANSSTDNFQIFRFSGPNNKIYFGDTGTNSLILTGHNLYLKANEGSTANSAVTPDLTIASGNVGIGTTSPAQLLSVAGHCVVGNTRLRIRRRRKKKLAPWEPEYDYLEIEIKAVQEGDEVLSLNEKTGRLEYQPILKLWDMGEQPIYELETESGKKIRTTGNHPYLVRLSSKFQVPSAHWVKVAELREGTEIAVPRPSFKVVEGAAKEGMLKHSVDFRTMLNAENENCILTHHKFDTPVAHSVGKIAFWIISEVFGKLQRIRGRRKKPHFVCNAVSDFWREFLKILLGVFSVRKFHGDYALAMPSFLSSFSMDIVLPNLMSRSAALCSRANLLRNDGLKVSMSSMVSSSSCRNAFDTSHPAASAARRSDSSFLRNFDGSSGFVSPPLNDFGFQIMPSSLRRLVRSFISFSSTNTLGRGVRSNSVREVIRESAVSIWRNYINKIKELSNNDDDVSWEKIISIKRSGWEQVWDITVKETHNFVANDLLAHNTYLTGGLGVGTTETTNGNITGTGRLSITSTTATSTLSTGGLAVGTSQFVVQQNSGNVGIGTTSPTSLLAVSGSGGNANLKVISTDANSARITLGRSIETGVLIESGIVTGSDLKISSGGTTMLYANSNGLVGIGTTSPAQTLSVQGNALISGNLTVANITATGTSLTLSGLPINSLLSTNASGVLTATSTPTFGNFNATSTTATSTLSTGGLAIGTSQFVVQQNSGNVGIGTVAPSSLLEISGSSPVFRVTATAGTAGSVFSGAASNDAYSQYSVSGGQNWRIGNKASSGFFTIAGGPDLGTNPRITIDTSGNVGIGTTSPAQLLSVAGHCVTGDTRLRRRRRRRKLGGGSSEFGDYEFNKDIYGETHVQLRGFSSVAKINGLSGGGLFVNAAVPERGALWSYLAAAASGILNSIEYLGRPGKKIKEGISAILADCARLGLRTQYSFASCNEVAVLGSDAVPATSQENQRNHQNDERPHQRTQITNSQLPTPNSELYEYVYDEVAIRDIEPGDEIASLDEQSGTIVWSKVNGLLDMGVKPIFKLTTASGKTIRTTGNHPYFVQIKNSTGTSVRLYESFQKSSREMFKSLRIWRNTAGLNSLAWMGMVMRVPSALRYMAWLPFWRANKKPHRVAARITSRGLGSFAIESGSGALRSHFDRGEAHRFSGMNWLGSCFAIFEMEFNYLADIFQSFFQGFALSIAALESGNISKKPASAVFLDNHGKFIHFERFLHSAIISSEKETINDRRRPDRKPLTNKYQLDTPAAVTRSDGRWVKVMYLKEGMKIAVASTNGRNAVWERIEKIEHLPEEQVYDIEVEDTHNFIGNDIVAHNTYLTGGLGVGTTETTAGNITGTGRLSITSTTATSTLSTGGLAIGTSQFVVQQNSGNVGIGTAGPSSLLEISGSSPVFRVTATAGTAGSVFSGAASNDAYSQYSVSGGQNWRIGNKASSGFFTIAGGPDLGTNPRITIDTSGNVGVGTTSPADLFSVGGIGYLSGALGVGVRTSAIIGNGGIVAASTIISQQANGNSFQASGTGSYFQFQAGGTNQFYFRDNNAVTYLKFDSSGSNQAGPNMVIMNSGNVGIGTTTPNWLLQVNGTRPSLALSDSSAGANLKHWLLSSQGGNLYVGTSTDAYGTSTPAALTITNAGNVGVGTAGPAGLLEIKSTNPNVFITDSLTGTATLTLRNSNGYTSDLKTGNATGLQFFTQSAERARIDTSGNLGIGTASPGFALDVQAIQPSVQIKATVGTSFSLLRLNNNGGDMYFGRDTSTGGALVSGGSAYAGVINVLGTSPLQFGTNNTARMTIDSSGNVGIGTTTPNWLLQVAGTRPSIALSDTSAGANLKHWLLSSQGGNLYIGTSTDAYGTSTPAALTITNAGNVGVGTANPSRILHVLSTSPQVRLGYDATNYTEEQVGSSGVWTLTSTAGDYRFLKSTGAQAWRFASDADVFQHLTANTGDFGTAAIPLRTGYFGTSLVDPLLVGGSGTTQTLTLKTTSGVGATGADMIFQVGNNGATEAMRILNNGNIGIGTTTPNWLLQVNGTRPSLALSDSSAGANLKHWLLSSQGGNLYIGTSTDAYGTSTPAALTITNAGNVGIGTVAPSSLLEISGSSPVFRVTATAGTAGSVFSGAASNDAYSQYSVSGGQNWRIGNKASSGFFTIAGGPDLGTNPRITIDTSGNVGIGTTSPAQLLSVAGNGYLTGGLGIGQVETTAGNITGTGRLSITSTTATSTLSTGGLAVGTSQFVVQQNSGNVGIGTANPQVPLQVNGRIAVNGNPVDVGPIIDIVGTYTPASGNAIGIQNRPTLNPGAGSSGYLYAGGGTINKAGSGTHAMFASLALNNPTIGANAGSTLTNAAIIYMTGTTAGATNNYALYSDSASQSYFAGNVGIGTTTPSGRLAVKGSTADSTAYAAYVENSSGTALLGVRNDGIMGFGTTTFASPLNGRFVFINPETDINHGAIFQYLPTNVNASAFIVDAPNTSSSATTVFNVRESSATQLFRVFGDGEVSIGAFGAAGDTALNVRSTSTVATSYIQRWADGGSTYRMVVRSDGNVGIGTTSPATLLALHASAPILTFGDSQASGIQYRIRDGSLAAGKFDFLNFNSGTSTLVFDSSDNVMLGGTTTPMTQNTGTTSLNIATRGNQPIVLSLGNGSICVNNTGGCQATSTGSISALRYTTGSTDLAENYTSPERLEAGDVVVPTEGATISKATTSYSGAIMGVISTDPGFVLGNAKGAYPLALSGRVPVKVSTEGGAVNIGDRLTSSSLPGVAMKATTSGPTLGIALDPFDGRAIATSTILGTSTVKVGTALVFLNLTYAKLDQGLARLSLGGSEGLSWSVDPRTGKVTGILGGDLDVNGNSLTNIGSILSQSGLWGIDAGGRMKMKSIETDHLTVGTPQAPTGITLYDQTTKAPYCLTINLGTVTSTSGTCESIVSAASPAPSATSTTTPVATPLPAAAPAGTTATTTSSTVASAATTTPSALAAAAPASTSSTTPATIAPATVTLPSLNTPTASSTVSTTTVALTL